ncbi:MAG: hypothetical protein CL677_08360, partial [Bdellovibrionaceae bacterium]|nr:hypothetical protein [Pseudobdellovibrionaceae bacterium]
MAEDENTEKKPPQQGEQRTTEILADIAPDEQEIRILVICKSLAKFKSIGSFLSRRGWPTFIVAGLGEAIQTAVKEVPHFVLISVDNPNPKVQKLPALLAQTFNTRVVMFGEDMTGQTMKKLNASRQRYVWKNAVSGPSIQWGLKKIIQQELNPDSDNSSDENNPSFGSDGEQGNIEVKGNSDKMKDLLRFANEDDDGAGGYSGNAEDGAGGSNGYTPSGESSDNGHAGMVGGTGQGSSNSGHMGGDQNYDPYAQSNSGSVSGGNSGHSQQHSSANGGMDTDSSTNGSNPTAEQGEAGSEGQGQSDSHDPYAHSSGVTAAAASEKSNAEHKDETDHSKSASSSGPSEDLPLWDDGEESSESSSNEGTDPYAHSSGKTATAKNQNPSEESTSNEDGSQAENTKGLQGKQADQKKPDNDDNSNNNQFAWEKRQDTAEELDKLKKKNKIIQTNKDDKAHSEQEKVDRERRNLKKIGEHEESEPMLEALYRAVQAAFNTSCNNNFNEMDPLKIAHAFRSFTVRSPGLNGYLLVAAPEGLVDEDFILDFRSSLIQNFHEIDAEFSVDVPDNIEVEPVQYVDWSDDISRFCLLNVHKSKELGVSFFVHEDMLPQSFSSHKGMIAIDIKDLS